MHQHTITLPGDFGKLCKTVDLCFQGLFFIISTWGVYGVFNCANRIGRIVQTSFGYPAMAITAADVVVAAGSLTVANMRNWGNMAGPTFCATRYGNIFLMPVAVAIAGFTGFWFGLRRKPGHQSF